MSPVLIYEEAKEIYAVINEHLDRSDEDIASLYQDMIEKAIRYAHIRAGWNRLSREEKLSRDPGRTLAHDALIASVHIVARTEGEIGKRWLEKLTDDRKRIGDFACYIALFEGIDAR